MLVLPHVAIRNLEVGSDSVAVDTILFASERDDCRRERVEVGPNTVSEPDEHDEERRHVHR
ncbi:hypothetical protein Nmn1133_01400 [Halosegnis longus]|uniref:Uncharacterized protein n=1 Tax=Halosegnis longus TaxID=2216012 RepID=A0AAJ4UUZ9_9EURY|nr:hypothetical protein Nmn1133_01400 [Salella cibi]